MKIIISGAGQVGSTPTENLSNEANDITVIDCNRDRLSALQQNLDIRTVHGQGSYPQILRRAGAEDTDMLIAVTGVDEVNMIVCQLAHTLFGVPRKIGRIRSHAFLSEKNLFDAVGHSFATVAIGGFSTHDASIGYFDDTAIEMVAVVFMIVSAINFSLHPGVRGAGIIVDGIWFRSG